jgi:Zn-dependent M28 family amino/carboxypeptidase
MVSRDLLRHYLLMFTGLLLVFLLVSTVLIYHLVVIRDSREHPPFKFNENLISIRNRLNHHVHLLSEEIGERHIANPASIDRTVDYILQEFEKAGFNPKLHAYGRDGLYHNVVAELAGGNKKDEIIIIGAHYDTVRLSPGADDNASGVAALLVIAGHLAGNRPEKTIRFIAFANEEQPFSESDDMGSRMYAREMRSRNENILVMFSLEMLGCYSDQAGSQNYPAPLNWFYPHTASFIAFIANISSRPLLLQAIRRFQRHSDFPVEGLAAPEIFLPDIRRSDHASFWDHGYKAVMITDTALYRNRNYHTAGDIARTLDYEKMATVIQGLILMVTDLAGPS